MPVYNPHSGKRYSFLEFFLRENEQLWGKVRIILLSIDISHEGIQLNALTSTTRLQRGLLRCARQSFSKQAPYCVVPRVTGIGKLQPGVGSSPFVRSGAEGERAPAPCEDRFVPTPFHHGRRVKLTAEVAEVA